jgi:hypothetical protein
MSFDQLTKFVIPVLSLVGTITSITKEQPLLAVCLLAVLVVSVVVNFAPKAYYRFLHWRRELADDRLAGEAWPELMMLVDQFGRFIENGRRDTIHGIVTRCGTSDDLKFWQMAKQHDFVPASVLWGPWNQLASRKNCRPDRLLLQDSVTFFTWLTRTYLYYVANAIFHRSVAALQEPLPEDAKRDLTVAREQVTRFMDDYRDFVDRTNRRLKTVELALPNVEQIPPL